MHLLTQVSGELEKVKIGEYVLTPPETHNRLSKDWYFNIKQETGDESPLLTQITTDELKKYLRKCKNKSSAGKDGIRYRMMKELPENMFLVLVKLFNACSKIGYFAQSWKQAITKMIHKPGKNKKECKGYHPISLMYRKTL